MISRRNRTLLSLTIFLGVLAWNVAAAAVKGETRSVGSLTPHEIEEQLQDCPLVQALNQHKIENNPSTSSLTSQIFAFLFPGSPAVNALLATLYISGPPNFLLALCPPNIDPSSLSVMVAFAVGGLLGDTLFHLLPEIFLGEDEHDSVKFVMVEPNKNLLLGVAIMVGFITFVAMDKGLRIATGGQGGHDHSHGHSHEKVDVAAKTTGAKKNASTDSLRARKSAGNGVTLPTEVQSTAKEINASVKLGGYLNLIADFTHNITDGLALSSSFYASPTIGATTTVAVFFHEIPHEVGDFALLIQSGFSKRAAMGAQFVTAVGAFLGTCIGIAVQELGGSSASADLQGTGLMGTSLQWGDMLLPFTAGTFLYVGTVAVIPELLETGPNKAQELRKTLMQFAAMFTGAGIMLAYVYLVQSILYQLLTDPAYRGLSCVCNKCKIQRAFASNFKILLRKQT
ncbi:ZIP zinc transporter-like protein [Phaeosphaeriaceae sp. PMI808]|nr:ZIP zinc transporter-like protein [Phaeosphaeriaceae sp. PMI808]